MKTLSIRSTVVFILFIAVFCLYLAGLMPTVSGGDSGELAAAGYTMGIAHAPGYPLFVMLGKIASVVIPWGNPAYRMNVYAALTAASAAAVLCAAIMQVCKGYLLPFAVSFFFAVLPAVWTAAYRTEVFALNGLCAILLLSIMLYSRDAYTLRTDRLVVFIFGLSLGNQHTMLLLTPALTVWLAVRFLQRKKLHTPAHCIREFVLLAGFFILGFSVYLFLPLRSSVQPLLDWEDPETWSRFWFVVGRMRYGSFQLAQGNPAPLSLLTIAKQFLFFGSLLFKSLGHAGSLLFLWGLAVMLRRWKKTDHVILFLALLGSGPGIFILSNVMPSDNTVYIMSRFLLLPLIPSFFIIVYGLSAVSANVSRYRTALIILLFLFLVPERITATIKHEGFRRNDLYVWDFGKNILKHLPEGSLVFSDRADEMEFVTAYLLYAQGSRPDVTFVDCNAGVSRSVYGDDYYRIWGKPRLERREKVEKDIIRTSSSPVFYGTLDTGQIAIPRIAEGFLFRVAEHNDQVHVYDWDAVLIRERGLQAHDARVVHLHQNTNSLLVRYYLDSAQYHRADRRIRLLQKYWGERTWGLMAAYWYYERKLYVRAEMEYEELLARFGDDAEIYGYLGALYNTEGYHTRAEEILKKALALKPDQAQSHYNLAVAYWHQQRWSDAEREFARTIQLDPKNTEAQKFYIKAKERREETK